MFLEFWGTFSVASGHSQERLVRSWVSFQGRCVCFIVLFPHAHGHRTNGGLFYIYLRSFLAPGLLIFNPRLANRVVSVARMLQNRPFFTSPCASVCMLPVGSGNLSHNQHVLVSIDYTRLNLHLNVQNNTRKTFTNNFFEVCGSFQALVNTAGACKIRSFGLERMKLVNHGAIHTRIQVGQGKSISDVWDDVYVSFHPRETTEPYSRLTWRAKPWGEKKQDFSILISWDIWGAITDCVRRLTLKMGFLQWIKRRREPGKPYGVLRSESTLNVGGLVVVP